MNKSGINIDFPKLNPSAWKQMIQFQLDGMDYTQQMIYHSLEGVDIKPFYTIEDVKQPIELPKNEWSIDENILVYEDLKASEMAQEAIEFGAKSIHFTVLNPQSNFNVLLKDINFNSIQVRISLQQLSEELIQRIETSEQKEVVFCIDPISKFFTTGNWYRNQKNDFELLSQFLRLIKKGFKTSLEINNYGIAESGAHSVEQLTLCLGHLAEYLHYFESTKELDLIEGISFNLGVGSNYFFEIAKTRALRLLIPSLLDEFNIAVDFEISSQTLSRYYTAYNCVQNLVRSSTSLLSSVLSSADKVAGLAHDNLVYFPNSPSNRLIRNQLLILKHEAGLDQHQDAANHSYYINYLTEQLAQKALQAFKLLEKNKGIIVQLKNGNIQKEIKNQHFKELKLYQDNKEILIGTNAYKDKREQLKKVAQKKPFLKKKARKTLIIPLISRRIASEWEEKRWNNE